MGNVDNKNPKQIRSDRKQFLDLKTFCPLPWMHLSLDPNGKTRLCCNANDITRDIIDKEGHPVFINQIEDVSNFLNLPLYKTIRKQMLRNQKPKACSTCYELERHGSISSRQQFKERWEDVIPEFLDSTEKDGTLKEVSIKYLDIPLGNVCNLRCRMCNPASSIQMKKDFDHLKIEYDHENIDNYSDWIKDPKLYSRLTPLLKTTEEIFFTGGEPLLIKEHEDILRKAIELKTAKNIKVKYNSNLTKLSSRLIDLWKEFREVEFNCSIDGFGEVNDYIRFPSKWSVMERALKRLDDLADKYPHIKIYIHSTFQVLNLFNIPDFLRWLGRAEWRNIHRVPFFLWVHEPAFFRSTVLPEHLKIKAIAGIEEALQETIPLFMDYNKNHDFWSREHLKVLSGYLRRMEVTPQEETHFKDFLNYTIKMDRFRKQDITQVIPEFKDLFLMYKKRKNL